MNAAWNFPLTLPTDSLVEKPADVAPIISVTSVFPTEPILCVHVLEGGGLQGPHWHFPTWIIK